MSSKSIFGTEREFVAWVKRRTTGPAPGLRLGIGDDAALVRLAPERELILTTDLTVEGVHFTPRLHPAEAVGHRALARSLSDIAAMGGTPRYALVSLVVSLRTSRTWIEGFYRGLMALAKRFDVALAGGDTTITRSFTAVDVVVAGEVRRGRALRRSGARPTDRVFVSGRLGLAAWGFELLRSRKRRLMPTEAAALRAHLYPQPQCALGGALQGLATSLMDLSDGLSLDLERLCEASGVGATLYQDRIPCPSLPNAAEALDLALHGGEDYQLVFTVPTAQAVKLPGRLERVPLTCIGEIQPTRGIRLLAPDGGVFPLTPKGYDHFRRR